MESRLASTLMTLSAGLVLLAAATVPAARGVASPSGHAAPAAVLTVETDSDGLFDVDLATGSLRHIPGTTGDDGNPAWSPDGKRLLFNREQDGNHLYTDFQPHDLYLIDADGRGLRRLTFNRDDDSFGKWSPDGRSIVFMSYRRGRTQICVMNVRTGAARTVADGWYPAWIPDRRIMFVTAAGVTTVRPYGADLHTVPDQSTPDGLVAAIPSPDGTKIALLQDDPDYDVYRLYLVDSDGHHLRLLVNGVMAVDPVAWTLDSGA